MPDQENLINRKAVAVGLPKTPIVPFFPSSGTGGDELQGMSVNDYFSAKLNAAKPQGIEDIPLSSFYIGDRYPETRPGTDYEEMAAQQQSPLDKLANGTIKMLGSATTSFASGTVGLLYGALAAAHDQRWASLIDNDVTRSMDEFSKKLEDYLPNYYTKAETNAEWYSPDNILTANFWSDKIIKNLGFSLGAIAGGAAWSSIFKSIGLTNALVKAGAGMEAATAVEAAMTQAPDLQKYNAIESALSSLSQKYLKTPAAAVLKNSDRILTSAMGTFGEASIEGLQNMNEFRSKAIDQYRDLYGKTPEGKDLEDINKFSDKIGMYTWGFNSLLLTGTNYIQLPKILGSSRRADKAMINEIGQETIGGDFTKTIAKTKFGKFVDSARGVGSLLFAPSEAFEEGTQFAIQTGVDDYFERAYKNKGDVKSFFSSLNQVAGNIFGEGIEKTLGSKEGLESILIGGISGGLQQAGFVGTYTDEKTGKTKIGFGKSGTLSEQGIFGLGGERGKNTDVAVAALNKTKLPQLLKDGAKYFGIAMGSQQMRQQAIANDDKLSEKDYETDYMFSYLMPRIKYGKLASVEGELAAYESQAMSEDGFNELKISGIVNKNETRPQFIQRINSVRDAAKDMEKLYSTINDKYESVYDNEGRRKYSDEVIDKLVYAASKIKNYDSRIPGVNEKLITAGINAQSLVDDVVKSGELSEENLKDVADQIKSLNGTDDEIEDSVQNVKDLAELALRRKKFIDDYNAIKATPEKFEDAPDVDTEETPEGEEIPEERKIKIKTKAGDVDLEVGTEYFLGNIVKKDKDGNDVKGFPRFTVLGENEDGTIKIKDSNGKLHDMTKAELAKFKLGKVSSTLSNKKAKYYLDNVNNVFEFNFGKGNKVQGRLEYSPKEGILEFVYKNKRGEEKRIEVTGDQFVARDGFLDPMIKKVGELTAAEKQLTEQFAAEQDTRKVDKRAARLSVLNNLFEEISSNQKKVDNLLQQKKNELETITKELKTLEEKIASGDITKRNNFKKTTNNAIKAANRLSRMQEQLRLEIESLEAERNEAELTLEWISDLAQNIDELPTDSKEFLQELRDQRSTLEDLILENGKSINAVSDMIDRAQDALESAIDLLRRWVSQFEKAYPKVPTNLGQEWVDFIKANPNFLKLAPKYKEDLAMLEDMIAQIEDFTIKPTEEEIAELRNDLEKLQDSLKEAEQQLKIKDAVISKFEEVAKQYQAQKAEEERIQKNQALKEEILGSADPGLQTRVYSKEYEPQAKKTELAVVLSTKLSSKSEAPHAKRTNLFGALFNKMSPSKKKKYKAVIVTSKNEADFKLGGLTQHLKDQSELPESEKAKIKPEKTIALVIVKQDTDGVYKPVDQDGNILEDVSVNNALYQVFPDPSLEWSEQYGGGSMFRKETPKERIEYYKKQYQEWVNETLDNPSSNVHSIEASFGTPQYVMNSDGTPNYDAVVSVVDAGLIDESNLEDDNVIYIPTTDNTVSKGSTSYDSPLGRPFLILNNAYVNLKNRLFNKKEAEAIYGAIYQLAVDINKNGNLKSETAKRYYNWLKSVVYWGKVRNAVGYNSIFFEDTEDGLMLYVSGKGKTYPFTPTAIRENKSELIDTLQMMYNNVNSTMVKKDDGSYSWKQPYEEILSVSEDGKVESKIWPNYQTYLLSSKGRKPEDVPLSTRIRPVRDVEGDVNRTGIYFTLSDTADAKRYGNPPVKTVVTPKTLAPKVVPSTPAATTKPAAQEAPEGTVELDGKTINTYTSPKGKKIKFAATRAALKNPKALGILPGGDLEAVLKELTDSGKTLDEAKESIRNAVKQYIATKIKETEGEEELFVPGEEEEEETTLVVEEEEMQVPEEEELVVEEEAPAKEERLPATITVTAEEEALMQQQMDETDDDVVLRKVIEEQANEFEREDWKKTEAWLKDKFPIIPVYRVKNIIKGANGLQAWGMLKNGAIYVYENAEVGTIYHEVFEGVWKLFADPAEKEAILKEFRERKGEFVDRPTGQKVKFSEATNEQIKEQLAEEFRDYVLYKKIPAKPTQGKPFILRLFADLVNFIKTFFTGNKAQVNTANLFDKIGTGYYKKYVPEAGALAFAKQGLIDIEEAYITAGSELRVKMPADTVHDIMQEMTYQTLRGIIEDNESLFNIPTMSKTELYNRLLPAIQKTVLKGRKEATKNLQLKKITEVAANEQINKSVQLWKDVTKNWKDLVDKHQEYLKVYSIEFDENDEIQFKDEDKVKESDYVDARKIDAFKKANSAIKLLFSTLPVMDSDNKPVYSSINGYKLVPASQAFISVMNNVHTSRTPDEMLERLREMANDDPNYRTLYRRLTKVDYSANTDSLDGITEVHDGQLLASFWRTFKKYNPDVKNVFIFEDGAVEVGDSNLATAARQVKSGYVNELIDLVKRKNPYFVYSQDRKAYIGNPAGVAKFGEFKPEGALTEIDKMVAFLKTLGIEFKAEDIAKLPGNVQDTFKDAVKGIKRSIEKTDMIVTMGGKVLKIDGRLMSLATIKATIDNPEFDSTFFNVKGERTQTFIGTNPSSDLFDYLSKVESMDDLIGTPYEYLVTDAFSKSYTDAEGNQVPTSVILSKIFNYKSGERKGKTENIMKPGYADGTINRSNGKKKESSKLNFRERLIQEINLNLKGYYYNLVPGDASIQHMTFMGNHINPDELLTTGYNTLNNIFKGYFISELELSRSDRRVAKDRNNKDLRFLKPILDAYDPSLHKDILKDKRSPLEVYNSFEKKINAAVQQFIKNESDNLKKTLTDYNIISVSPEGYSVENIGFQETDNVSDEALNRQLNSLTINYVINNIELHKLLYSDPYQYSDELKRIKSFLSPRQAIVHSSEEMNKVFDRVWNKGYEKDDVGYTDMTQEFFRTTTLADVKATSALKDYGIYDETDGSGIIAMKAYRNLRIRAADWTDNEEKQYRYDIAWMKRDKGLPVSSEEQKLLNAGNPEVMSAYTPYKPIVAGDKANGQSFNDVVLDKFALYPLSYRIMKEINNSSNGVKLYEKMQNENIDYVVFQSGRKVGAEGTNQVYNEDASFNESEYEGIVNVPFNIISVQSEVPSKEEAVVTRGSQVTKLVTMDFMQAGVPIDFMSKEKDFTKRYIAWNALADKTSYNGGDNLYNEIKTNEKLLKALTDFGYKTLLKRMGIEETIVDGQRRFEIKDFSKVAETLRDEILKREVNDNVSDSLAGFLEGDAVLEATPAYQQVRNILYSIADKNVISTKISGSQKVQIPSTFMESNRLKAEGKEGKVFSTENGLKFYEKDGERVCEIMIGRWFDSPLSDEELLDMWYEKNEDGTRSTKLTEEGKKILSGVAFRIPTQKQNSIDSFVIKKFLPREFGDSVVIPSELVRKVGSDFDIDKLFIYLKNTYIDAKGQLKLIPYFGIGDDARSKYEPIFYDILQSKIDRAEAKKLSQTKLQAMFGDIALGQAKEKTTAKWVPLFKQFFSEEVIDGKLNVRNVEDIFMMRLQKLGKKLDKLTDYDVQEMLLDEFMDRMYKKSLENEYIQSMQNLISHPLNFDNLIKPNSADPLKDLAGDITKKLGLQKLDSSSTSSLISRDYMTRLRHAFVTGKYAIGIAAVNQTNHSLNQRVPIYIDLDRFDNLSETDKFWITGGTKDRKDAVLKFKDNEFNQIDVDGKSVTTLSMIKNKANENISDIIGMFIDGYVDISKGPWIMELGATPNVASTWLFLVKAGVPIKTVAYFMNQPIIRDYLRMIENEGYSWLFIDEFVKNIKESDKYRTSRSINDVRTLPSATKMYETIGKEKLDQDERINQHFVLNEFLKYATMANQMFQVTQGSNFDTSTFNDPYLIFKKLRQYEKAQNTIISSVDKILDNSFIGDLREKLDNIRGAFAEILKSDHPTVRNVVQKVLDPYVDMPDREFVKIAQKIVNDLFDWAVQVKGGANSQIESILLSDNNAAKEVDKFVKEVKANSKHPLYNNQVINMFTPHFSSRDNSVQNLKLNNKTNKVYDQNQVIYSFEELRKYLNGINSPLYKKIVKLAVLQSGLSNSPISFTSLLPYQDFKEEYNEVLSKLEKITNLEDFADLDVFQRNNWNDDDIVPYRKGKMKFPKEITPEGKTIYTGPPYYSELRWGRGFGDVKKAMTDGKIPQLIRLDSRSKQAGDDVIVFSWEVGTKKDKQEARARGDLSYIQKGLFKKVYNGGQPYMIEDYFGNPQFVYKMINAWGDSHQEEGRYFSANEFYDHARKSKINNGFIPVENEVDDTTVVAFFEGTAGPFSTGKETAPTPAEPSDSSEIDDVLNNKLDKGCKK